VSPALLHCEQLGAHVSEAALPVHVPEAGLYHVILGQKARQDLKTNTFPST